MIKQTFLTIINQKSSAILIVTFLVLLPINGGSTLHHRWTTIGPWHSMAFQAPQQQEFTPCQVAQDRNRTVRPFIESGDMEILMRSLYIYIFMNL